MPEIKDDEPVLEDVCCFQCGAGASQHEYDHTGYRYDWLWICSEECNDSLLLSVAREFGMTTQEEPT